MPILLLALVSVASAPAAPAAPSLQLHGAADGDFTLLLDGAVVATSAPLEVRAGGRLFSSADGTLVRAGKSTTSSGTDGLGSFTEVRSAWTAGTTPLETAVRTYADCLVFEQHFPAGVSDTSGGEPGSVIATFPSLQLGDAAKRGFLAFGGRQLEDCFAGGLSDLGSLPTGDGGGGPLAVFGQNGSSLVLSAASEFMSAAWAQVDRHAPSPVLSSGMLGTITSLPAGWKFLTIAVGGGGPSQGVVALGQLLQKMYGKDATKSREGDLTLSTLGVSTDNGAYFYGKPEQGKDFEQTILDMHSYAEQSRLPYSYALLDSWWYEKGKGGGVKNWTAQPQIFPDGMAYLNEHTKWKWQLHNRYWATDNIYAKQNGGDYDFIVEKSYAIPTEQKLWDDLIANGTSWGMETYEQDWLCTEFDGMNATKQNATIGRDWLMQMGSGASKSAASIQYCMAYPRHVMQSLEIPAVTQVRSSCDYHPGNTDGCAYPYCQFNIATSSLLAYSVGIAPSKDNFWSSEVQPGGKFGNSTEPYGELGGVITAYSTGPVAIGDGIGFTDVELVLRACTAISGSLLQPSRPATAIDACFFQAAFGGTVGPVASKPKNYPVWSSHTEVSVCTGDTSCAPVKFGHVFAVHLKAPFKLTPVMLPLDVDSGTAARPMLQWTGWGPSTNITLGQFSAAQPVALPACAAHDFQLHHMAPIFALGSRKVALLGEPAKWVPIAGRRIGRISVSATKGLTVDLMGDAGEEVELVFAELSSAAGHISVVALNCTIGATKTAVVVFPSAGAPTCA